MIGEAAGLMGVRAPDGVLIRRLTDEADMLAAARMADEVFGGPGIAETLAHDLARRIAAGDPLEMWAAEADGHIVSAGRIDPIPGTDVAGIRGGATRPEYRGRGIYRALTSARVESVMRHGVRYIHSDSTEDSRPILERSGLVKVSETTPWTWTR
ncbi:GNAT family N-acetyltransferase [Microbacterium gorillae]|uniref:GNAT family N-acetyltransferase n=1 Tax=Microbacterium gorillae TaxID=1231063 RepID=UPI002DDD4EDD|nr:GNAT family N-acetyltransferase [Microbacterium gorillae]